MSRKIDPVEEENRLHTTLPLPFSIPLAIRLEILLTQRTSGIFFQPLANTVGMELMLTGQIKTVFSFLKVAVTDSTHVLIFLPVGILVVAVLGDWELFDLLLGQPGLLVPISCTPSQQSNKCSRVNNDNSSSPGFHRVAEHVPLSGCLQTSAHHHPEQVEGRFLHIVPSSSHHADQSW